MNNDILQKFTTHLKNSLASSVNLAIELNRKMVSVDYLLYGLVSQRGSIAAEILLKSGLRPESLKKLIASHNPQKNIPKNASPTSPDFVLPEFSDASRKIIEKSALIATKYQHQYIGTEHLLYSILQVDKEKLQNRLQKFEINLKFLEQQVAAVLKSTSKFPDLTEVFKNEDIDEINPLITPSSETTKQPQQTSSALEFFCTHLTDAELQKDIDPVIGRHEEINRLIHILSRRTKNNPVLIGEPGVGKTAIIEGLAKRIIEGNVPDVLADKKIYSLDISLVIAGTIYRGEFEGRFKQIIDEVKSNKDIILFIDEIHTLSGAGGTGSGTLDAANILKPALSKGQIRCIGATTIAEYQKYIEADGALERRFQHILVEEQPHDEVIEVLKGLRKNYEKFHNVKITDEAIEAAVRLSSRYIQDKFLPDKAIDLIDEAASKFRIRKKTDILTKTIKNLEKELISVAGTKDQAVNSENFPHAVHLRNKEHAIKQKIVNYKNLQLRSPRPIFGTIVGSDIAQVISRMMKIPLQDLVTSDKHKLLTLEKQLSSKVIGQTEAIKTVSGFIRRSRAGLVNPNKPIASFIFMGPSGVGKTELAKVLAASIFDDAHALLRFDMSEFGESFNISKLIGAPAGYVGYKEGAKLTDQVRRKPYCVILFDEIEKAHPDVFNLFLQILDEGHLTDATGRKVNFKNTIIIMTSNIGLDQFNTHSSMGFGTHTSETKEIENFDLIKGQVISRLEKEFRPEFINRIDQVVVFRPLSLENITEITKLQIKRIAERLKEKDLSITINNSVIHFIAKQGYRPDQGARAIQRMIQNLIENPLAELLLEDRFSDGDEIKVKLKNKELVFTK